MSEPALGIVELQSIARGIVVADAMVKKAPVRILQCHPISPGKHLVIIAGGVAEVDEAMQAGIAAAGSTIVDRLFLPQVHESLTPLIAGKPAPAGKLESVAIFETYSVCSAIVAADAAVKAAEVVLVDLRLGQGIGGKAFFSMSGELYAVEAASLAAQAAIEPGLLVGVELIPAPHDDLRTRLFF